MIERLLLTMTQVVVLPLDGGAIHKGTVGMTVFDGEARYFRWTISAMI